MNRLDEDSDGESSESSDDGTTIASNPISKEPLNLMVCKCDKNFRGMDCLDRAQVNKECSGIGVIQLPTYLI